MNVGQLIDVLRALPPHASVLLDGREGNAPLGCIEVQRNRNGQPHEVVFQPDVKPD
ncbi:MAG TPA: hypothetical protein VIO81_16990 [Methyloversatilis sp.]